MARAKKSLILSSLRGQIGDLVIKQYRHGTVVSRVPDMSQVKPTKNQKIKRSRFKDAVAYARGIIADPRKKEQFRQKIKRGKSVYHAAIAEYLRKNP